MFDTLEETIKKIREQKPLILNLTNFVTMDFVANGLLAIGAAPIMCSSIEELEEMIHLASSVVINIGTLNRDFIELAYAAAKITSQNKKPLILDPVGAGASVLRTRTALHLLKEFSISIVRGNASEIMALSGEAFSTRGVESTKNTEEGLKYAQHISQLYQTAVLMSGAIDVVVSNSHMHKSSFGSPLMASVTGMGCLLSAVSAAFHSVNTDPMSSAALATMYYTLCGEMAAQKARGPASFKTAFLDLLFCPDFSYIQNQLQELCYEI